MTNKEREEAITTIKRLDRDFGDYEPNHKVFENILSALKGEWIPVSERLPEERHTYEVTLRGIGELEGIDNEVAYATWLGNKNNRENNWLYHDVNNWKDKEVIAWKLRSKPYKAESEETR